MSRNLVHEIICVRHAAAQEITPSDPENDERRPLSAEGVEQAKHLRAAIHGAEIEWAVPSFAKRACDTALIATGAESVYDKPRAILQPIWELYSLGFQIDEAIESMIDELADNREPVTASRCYNHANAVALDIFAHRAWAAVLNTIWGSEKSRVLLVGHDILLQAMAGVACPMQSAQICSTPLRPCEGFTIHCAEGNPLCGHIKHLPVPA